MVTPEPEWIEYPTLLDFPAPRLRVYPRETVVAEKYQAMVMLGIANSRMKDFYDLWVLARRFEFSGPVLCAAIRSTFDRRMTPLSEGVPLALTPAFTTNPLKLRQWQGFHMKNRLEEDAFDLSSLARVLQGFLLPPTLALVEGKDFGMRWQPNGPWQQ